MLKVSETLNVNDWLVFSLNPVQDRGFSSSAGYAWAISIDDILIRIGTNRQRAIFRRTTYKSCEHDTTALLSEHYMKSVSKRS